MTPKRLGSAFLILSAAALSMTMAAGCDEMGRSRRSKHPQPYVDDAAKQPPPISGEAGAPVNPLFAPQPGDVQL